MMKTFKDLEFKGGVGFYPLQAKEQAKMNFDNGYGVSVVWGGSTYGDRKNPYEVAILKEGAIYYESGISGDVIGYCNVRKITKIMKQVQELKQ